MQKNRAKKLFVNLSASIVVMAVLILFLEMVLRYSLGENLRYDYYGDLWTLKPGQQGFTYPNKKIATINSEGYRGGVQGSEGKTIVCLGDSLTFGYSIGDNDTLTHNLSQLLKKKGLKQYHIINGGVPGYGIGQMIDVYFLKYEKLSPEIVILSFIEGDIFRQAPEDDSFFHRKMIFRKLIRSSSLVAYLKPRLEVFRGAIMGSGKFTARNYEVFFQKDMKKIAEFNEKLKKQGVTLILHAWIYKRKHYEFYNKVAAWTADKDLNLFPNYYQQVIENYPGDISDLFAEDGHPSEIQTKRLAAIMAGDLILFLFSDSIDKNKL